MLFQSAVLQVHRPEREWQPRQRQDQHRLVARTGREAARRRETFGVGRRFEHGRFLGLAGASESFADNPKLRHPSPPLSRAPAQTHYWPAPWPCVGPHHGYVHTAPSWLVANDPTAPRLSVGSPPQTPARWRTYA